MSYVSTRNARLDTTKAVEGAGKKAEGIRAQVAEIRTSSRLTPEGKNEYVGDLVRQGRESVSPALETAAHLASGGRKKAEQALLQTGPDDLREGALRFRPGARPRACGRCGGPECPRERIHQAGTAEPGGPVRNRRCHKGDRRCRPGREEDHSERRVVKTTYPAHLPPQDTSGVPASQAN
jgi:hypothetical protein